MPCVFLVLEVQFVSCAALVAIFLFPQELGQSPSGRTHVEVAVDKLPKCHIILSIHSIRECSQLACFEFFVADTLLVGSLLLGFQLRQDRLPAFPCGGVSFANGLDTLPRAFPQHHNRPWSVAAYSKPFQILPTNMRLVCYFCQ